MRVIILRTYADGSGTEYINVPFTGDGTVQTATKIAKELQDKDIAKNGSWSDAYYVATIEQVV